MRTRASATLALCMVLGIAGDVFPQSAGEDPVSGMLRHGAISFAVPADWKKVKFSIYGRRKKERCTVITRDGVPLQSIVACYGDADLPFRNTKKKLSPGMLPQEIADVVVDDLELDRQIKNLVVQERRPVTIGGSPAFCIVYTYRDDGQLQYKSSYCGILKSGRYYGMHYAAPARHYYDAYAGVFDRIVGSMRLSD